MVTEKYFSAQIQGTQQRHRSDSCVLCRLLPSHWKGCGCSDGRYIPKCALGLTFPWALGDLDWHPIQTSHQPKNVAVPARSLCRYFPVILPVPFNKCLKGHHPITATQFHQRSGILRRLLWRYSWWTVHSCCLEYISKPWQRLTLQMLLQRKKIRYTGKATQIFYRDCASWQLRTRHGYCSCYGSTSFPCERVWKHGMEISWAGFQTNYSAALWLQLQHSPTPPLQLNFQLYGLNAGFSFAKSKTKAARRQHTAKDPFWLYLSVGILKQGRPQRENSTREGKGEDRYQQKCTVPWKETWFLFFPTVEGNPIFLNSFDLLTSRLLLND